MLSIVTAPAFSQLYFKGALRASQDKLYRNLVQNTINKNLSLSLTDSTEDNWQDAFNALEVTRYQSLWVNGRIAIAAEQLQSRSVMFQYAALELFYSCFADKFYNEVKYLLMQTSDPKTFALCAEYILQSSKGAENVSFLSVKTSGLLSANIDNAILLQLQNHLSQTKQNFSVPDISSFFQKNYLPGKVLVFSFQRKNRDFPGLAMVRDGNGNFIKDSSGAYFSVPQLARANSNLPGYLSNGNTPEGIFRMKGYDVSRSTFIGPTVNVQLTMPFERSPKYFYADSAISDTIWNIDRYKKLLPVSLKEYYPLYQSYYAGKAGRTEIIIHGSTVNPQYYAQQPYFPLTPTQGCLTSKETWDPESGQRTQSDQQLLINALIKAGGADGYVIVINISDDERAVVPADILRFFNKK